MTESCVTVDRSPRKRLGGVLAVYSIALLARAGFGLTAAPAGRDSSSLQYDDERWYWTAAEAYLRGEGLVGEFGHRAERMPLYPWFLSLSAATKAGPDAARWAQWVLGAAAAGVTYLLAGRAGGVPFVAGAIIALDPAIVGCASLLLTEALFVTAIAGLWYVAWPLRRRVFQSSWRWAATGALACICIYLRESSLLMIVALAGYLVVVRRDRSAIGGALAVVLMIILALAPWAQRNRKVIGQWCWLTTRSGISLYDGVRPGATGASDLAGIKDAPEVAGLNEAQWNEHFLEASRRAIRDDPGRIARLAAVKVARTWSPVLHASEYSAPWLRLVVAAWYIPLYAAALIGVWSARRDWETCVGLLLPAMCVTVAHCIFVGSVRYRLAALPALAVLAAIGIRFLVNRSRGGSGVAGAR